MKAHHYHFLSTREFSPTPVSKKGLKHPALPSSSLGSLLWCRLNSEHNSPSPIHKQRQKSGTHKVFWIGACKWTLIFVEPAFKAVASWLIMVLSQGAIDCSSLRSNSPSVRSPWDIKSMFNSSAKCQAYTLCLAVSHFCICPITTLPHTHFGSLLQCSTPEGLNCIPTYNSPQYPWNYFFCVYKHFVCLYVCVLCACLVPTEARTDGTLGPL